MAIRALSSMDSIRYVLDSDPAKGTESEAADATFFTLSPLTPRQRAAIEDATTHWLRQPESPEDEGAVRVDVNLRLYLIAKHGLRGWEHFPGPDGSDVAFAVESKVLGGDRLPCASDADMARLPQGAIQELAVRVNRLSQPDPAELKG